MQFVDNGPSSIPRSVVNEDRMAPRTDHLRFDQAMKQFADSFRRYGKDLFLIIAGDHDSSVGGERLSMWRMLPSKIIPQVGGDSMGLTNR